MFEPALLDNVLELAHTNGTEGASRKASLLSFVENDLASLPENWDSYGAYPIHPEVLKKLSALIKGVPHTFWASVSEDEITPNPSGTVSVEWQRAGVKIFLEIGSQFSTYFIKENGVLIETHKGLPLEDQADRKSFLHILKRYFPA
ncbi:MAG: hypothetical protein ACKVUS_09885 [Saprospiraceae bacterium]